MKQEFDSLYREYFPRIYAFLYKLTGSQDLAEELTQETFYQAFVSFYRFRGDSDVFTWLASIGKHVYYHYLRKNKRVRATESEARVWEEPELAVTEHLADTVERRMLREDTRRMLLSLPKKYRDVVILRVYAEMSFAQIGDALHISENSARVIYWRAKKMMMEAMQDEYDL